MRFQEGYPRRASRSVGQFRMGEWRESCPRGPQLNVNPQEAFECVAKDKGQHEEKNQPVHLPTKKRNVQFEKYVLIIPKNYQ